MAVTQYEDDWFGPDNQEYENCREFSLIDPPDLVADDDLEEDTADERPCQPRTGPEILQRTDHHIKQSIEHQHEAVKWLDNASPFDPNDRFWTDGLQVRPRPLQPDYSMFCDSPFLVEKIFELKTSFDNVDKDTFQNSRADVNPYERLGKSCFNNKFAVKMANLDSLFNLLNEIKLLPGEEALRVADVCAGPGGFSEYILWRANENKKAQKYECYQQARAFGITLLTDNHALNFTPDRVAREGQPFFPHRGTKDGNGDITNLDNLDAFVDYVLRDGIQENPPSAHVPLVLGDGATIFEGDENNQEYIVSHMLLGQFLTALSLLRAGGSFLCKLYDCFTPFTVGLLYFTYRHFDRMSITKPLTSRPSNSERYVLFRGFKTTNPAAAIAYLRSVSEEMTELGGKRDRLVAQRELLKGGLQESLAQVDKAIQDLPSVYSIVPMELVQRGAFRSYIQAINTDLACKQLSHLRKISDHIRDPKSVYINWDQDQEIRKRCLDLWRVPPGKGGGKGKGKGGKGKGTFGKGKGKGKGWDSSWQSYDEEW
uniref:Cap-specific mRNA (nucleoside-2'-O-)-methyltransferase 1 n=1 Tax=Eutreptiella gymnastica TaxID=73025 RepID=A0A7S4GDQ9_9EUGL